MIDNLPVSIVAARAHGGTIGADARLPWHIPTDLARFKALTLGKPVVMGRKTFDAIGRVLPGRITIVVGRVTRTGDAEGVVYKASLPEALSAAATSARQTGASEIMVAGGGQVFAALLPVADRLYLTEVDLDVAGDVYFPAFERAAWDEIGRIAPLRAEDDEAAITFVDMRRRRPDTPL